MTYEHNVTAGYVARHVPRSGTVGREVALLDIAQDFLLTYLHREGLFDGLLVFKGGTALRKLFAGSAGRFSTDMDFALADLNGDRDKAAELAADAIDGEELGPFRYRTDQRRGRWEVWIGGTFGDVPIPLKLEVGPPCWLEPERRAFVEVPIHGQYQFVLPELPTMALEENLAEKIARLTRVSTARDAADLIWAATTSPHSGIDRTLLRRIAVLKVWVDNHGLDGHWQPAVGPKPFDPLVWLDDRQDWDDEDIGLLAHPPPSLAELQADLVRYYRTIADLSEDEQRFARCLARDRAEVIRAISHLPGSTHLPEHLW